MLSQIDTHWASVWYAVFNFLIYLFVYPFPNLTLIIIVQCHTQQYVTDQAKILYTNIPKSIKSIISPAIYDHCMECPCLFFRIGVSDDV